VNGETEFQKFGKSLVEHGAESAESRAIIAA
jgi:hypothetical protein